MTAQKYRKKPVVIEAVQWTGQNPVHIMDFLGVDELAITTADDTLYPVAITIATLEGHMMAEVGDWIIRGVAGEFYPCKPGIFAATYEPVAVRNVTATITPTIHIEPGPGSDPGAVAVDLMAALEKSVVDAKAKRRAR